MSLDYRREIDGLRALAVLPVILFHAGFTWVGGGFVGVDVFFVISGYLITMLVLNEQDAGTFSLLEFYERRMRRILPALFFVMACCIPFAWQWMVPQQLEQFGYALIGVSVFVYNFILWQDNDYFSQSAELKPLLHTWSLSVEEQFYLLFPLLLIVLRDRRRAVIVIALIAGASLLLSQWSGLIAKTTPVWFSQASWASFYLPTGRAWELLAGSLAAFYLQRHPSRSAKWGEFASVTGIMMIVASYLLYDKTIPFPSIYTIMPVAGALLIILHATPATYVGRLLAMRLPVGIGLVSYSAYLWHQPLLAFSRLQLEQLNSWQSAGLLFASLVLATLTWRYIERPFRDRRFLSRRQIFLASAAGIVLFIGVGIALLGGAPSRFPPQDRYLLNLRSEAQLDYVRDRFNQYRGTKDPVVPSARLFEDTSARKIAIIGDSMAMDFVNIIAEGQGFGDAQVRTHLVSVVCQMVADERVAQAQRVALQQDFCQAQGGLSRALPLVRQADLVILVAWWEPWALARIQETIQALQLRSDQRLMMVGKKHFGSIVPLRYVGLDTQQRLALRNLPSPEIQEMNNILKAAVPDGYFIDIQAQLCPDKAGCPIFTEDEKLISFDGSHLTQDGAQYAAKRLRIKW